MTVQDAGYKLAIRKDEKKFGRRLTMTDQVIRDGGSGETKVSLAGLSAEGIL